MERNTEQYNMGTIDISIVVMLFIAKTKSIRNKEIFTILSFVNQWILSNLFE